MEHGRRRQSHAKTQPFYPQAHTTYSLEIQLQFGHPVQAKTASLQRSPESRSGDESRPESSNSKVERGRNPEDEKDNRGQEMRIWSIHLSTILLLLTQL